MFSRNNNVNKRIKNETTDVIDATDSDTKPLKFTKEDILQTIENFFGSVHNVLQIAGEAGTYLILGPTESGKTASIGAMTREAQQWSRQGLIDIEPVIPSSFLIVSGTEELTSDFDWCKEKYVPFPLSDNVIDNIIKARTSEMEQGAALMSKKEDRHITPSEWAKKNAMFITLDDFYGKVDSSRPDNAVNQLVTKARHFNITLFVLAQGFNQCSPVIKDNARCIITFRLNAAHHSDILKNRTGKRDDELVKKLVEHNEKPYHPVVYYRTWKLSEPRYGGIPARPLCISPFTPIGYDDSEEGIDESESEISDSGEYSE